MVMFACQLDYSVSSIVESTENKEKSKIPVLIRLFCCVKHFAHDFPLVSLYADQWFTQ